MISRSQIARALVIFRRAIELVEFGGRIAQHQERLIGIRRKLRGPLEQGQRRGGAKQLLRCRSPCWIRSAAAGLDAPLRSPRSLMPSLYPATAATAAGTVRRMQIGRPASQNVVSLRTGSHRSGSFWDTLR